MSSALAQPELTVTPAVFVPHQPLLRQHTVKDQIEVFNVFRVRKRQAVVPWLEANITLPYKFAPNSSGPFSIKSRPYMRPILECWNPESGVQYCANSAGTQTNKSSVLTLGAAYRLVNDPLPMIIVGTSKDWTKEELSEKRLKVLIEENPILAAQMPANRDLFRTMSMDMSGGNVRFVGGNSPGALGGGTFGIVAIDEAAKLKHQGSEQTPEAHPINLAFKRTDAFGAMGFHYISSTPNVSTHLFWQLIMEGDQTHFWVECPHCHNHFFFDFIGTDEDREEYAATVGVSLPSDYKALTWDPEAKGNDGRWIEDEVRASTRYICPHNGCEITENERQPMVDDCQEHRHYTAAPASKRSFIIPSFYSPTISFATMSMEFLKSIELSLFGLQDYYNSRLARPFEVIKKNVKRENVLSLRGTHARGTVPRRPFLIFITADPGESKTHWSVTALMHDGALIVIDWGTVLAIEDLDSDAFRTAHRYSLAGTDEMIEPDVGYIDSGFSTIRVYDICDRRRPIARGVPSFRWWPTKGSNTRTGTYTRAKISSHPALELYTYVDHTAKTELYGMRIAGAKDPAVVIPVNADVIRSGDDKGLVMGLSGQKMITVGDHEEWKRLPHDHYGDTLKIAMVGGWIARDLAASLHDRV